MSAVRRNSHRAMAVLAAEPFGAVVSHLFHIHAHICFTSVHASFPELKGLGS